MKILLSSFCLLFLTAEVFSQSRITGKVVTADGRPVSFSNVLLLNSSDTSFVKGAVANEAGEYELDRLKQGKYFLQHTAVGYKTNSSSLFELILAEGSKNFDPVVIEEDMQQLDEVTVTGQKPFFQQEIDRTIVNVQNSVLTRGSSVLQVLERSPGVYINRANSDIALNGKSGVMIMQNGKLMRMSNEQAITLLNSLNADNVEKIELLTTPPSNYDAEGNAGMINIVFKKGQEFGTKGSFSLTGGYGKAEKVVSSINLTRKTLKTDIYSSYSFSHDKSYAHADGDGFHNTPVMGPLNFVFRGNYGSVTNNHNATLGMDTRVSAKTTIGSSISWNYSNVLSDNANRGEYTILPDSLLVMNAGLNGQDQWTNVIANLYVEREIKEGERINVDLDYISFDNKNNTEIYTSFTDRDGDEVATNGGLFSARQTGVAKTPLQIGVAKLDYVKPLSKQVKLEAGIKGTYTVTSNGSSIKSLVEDEWINNDNTSNSIDMTEGIGAIYTSVNSQIGSSVNLIVGSRYEYSHTQMDAEKEENRVDRKLGKLFPSLFLSKKIGDKSEFQFSYTKRISRPSYSDLASFILYQDPISVRIGNPSLKPVITNNLKMGYNYKGYSFSVLLSRDDSPISRYQVIASPQGDIFHVTSLNLEYQNNVDFQVNAPFQIGNWWSMNYNFGAGWRRYKLSYTEEPLKNEYIMYTMSTSQTVKLPKSFSMEISGWCVTPHYNGTVKGYWFGMLNAGIKKDLKNGLGSFQLSVSDILKTMKFCNYYGHVTEEVFSLKSETLFHVESSMTPIVRLSYFKSFGNSSVKDPRQRGIGSKDERDRIKKD